MSGYRLFKVVRQNTSGELVPVNVEVHCNTGAARIKSVYTQLAQMEPGFMVLMPHFLCLVFDWLWFSWEERMGQDQQSLFVDEDGLFEDDRAVHQTLLILPRPLLPAKPKPVKHKTKKMRHRHHKAQIHLRKLHVYRLDPGRSRLAMNLDVDRNKFSRSVT